MGAVATAGAGGLLAQQRWFKTRRELLFFLLPVASLLISSALALSGLIRVECSLGPWTPSRHAAAPAWLSEFVPAAQHSAGICRAEAVTTR